MGIGLFFTYNYPRLLIVAVHIVPSEIQTVTMERELNVWTEKNMRVAIIGFFIDIA